MERLSDSLLNLYNRFYQAKLTGALKKDELSEIFKIIGILSANQIKKGRMSEEDVRSLESFLVVNPHYFQVTHENLKEAVSSILEGHDAAVQERMQRYPANPVVYRK